MDQIKTAFDLAKLTEQVISLAPKFFVAILILFAFWLFYRISRRPLRSILDRSKMAPALIGLLVDNIYRFTMMIFGFVMAADQLGINVGAALAGIGVAGIAVGFAAKDALANTIAGFMIFWDKPFAVGDWVSVADEYGKVSDITLRTTRIRTRNNTVVVIPNQKIIDDVLINHTKDGAMRVVVPISIAYKEQIAAARGVLLAAASKLNGIMSDPPPDVSVSNLNDSSVDLQFRVWIADATDEMPTLEKARELCKVALDEAGIQIPFPHLQLFVDEIKDKALAAVARLPQLGKAGESER